jgi:phosphohistidine phosphatase
MIVGHNPTITFLADYLTSAPLESMETGSAVVITFDDLSWEEISQNTGNFLGYFDKHTT